ncbi:MAG: DNA polymerase III subunit alpha [Cryomorphaceae bacterium]|nr:DNA polymerase III subunit alpha [Cryomorphaceae bacterium]
MFAHTYYTLRYGIISEVEWVELAMACGYRQLVICDINSTSAVFPAMKAGQKCGLQIIPGVDVRNGIQRCYILVAQTWSGFAAINRFVSQHHNFPKHPPQWEGVLVIYPFHKDTFFALKENEYIGIKPNEINLLPFSPWKYHTHKLLAAPQMTFRNKRDFNAHRLLRAIDNNCLLSKLPRHEQAAETDLVLTDTQFRKAYEQTPTLVAKTEKLLESCCFHFTFGQPQNKDRIGASAEEDAQLLRTMAETGLLKRYQKSTVELQTRLDKELEIIIQKGFVGYFLIAADIIRFATEKGFFHVGRGSGANSLVAYCMGITDVDPIDLDLYFERFINLYRENPPDFDLDFSWRDRDEVIKYIFRTHGEENTALLAAFNTFKFRSTVREMGKVFGLPKSEIDRLAHRQQPDDHLQSLVLKYSKYIEGFPNYISIHAGGVLIARKGIHHFSPTFMPPKGFPTVQFDMYTAEEVGLYKFDILSQRGLGHIRDAVNIVQENESLTIDIHDIPRFKSDPKIRQLLETGNTIGAFYVESPAMRQLLRKMECRDYRSLVAASSIIRPGVSGSGMMQEYIKRYRNPEARKNAHPVLLDIMPETFGVMVYQEDVIKVAHYFAGLTLGEADVLRRGMSGKSRSRKEFDRIKKRYFENCQQRGHSETLATEVWRQIESFAGYSFAKGHSASFAVESFQSLYLRAHHPLAFITAIINNHGGFYSTETYVHEAQRLGADVQPPCINQSDWQSRLTQNRIFLGLELISGLEQKVIGRIISSRQNDGPFTDFEDVHHRIFPGPEQMDILIRVGALRTIEPQKQRLYWQSGMMYGKKQTRPQEGELFRMPTRSFTLPALEVEPRQDAYDQLELLGFALCSPFDLLSSPLPEHLPARLFSSYIGKDIVAIGYLITIKPTRTSKGERMYFGTFIDQNGDWIDSVHFPKIARLYPFRGRGIYRIEGKVDAQYDVVNINVKKMEKLT